MAEISTARAYAALYGPTAGDQVRLGDTDLWIQIERRPHRRRRGGGLRRRQVDPRVDGAGRPRTRAEGALDTVITNAIVLDWWGIVRADVGIRDGRIVALGRSGNPDIADGVAPRSAIGPSTDVISGEGRILTAGGDRLARAPALALADPRGARHRHHDRRRRRHRALARAPRRRRSPPARGTCSACTARLDPLPVNVLLLGKGNTVSAGGAARAGAGGRRAATRCTRTGARTPAAIDAALRAADEWGLQVALHSDSLNEAGFVESTLARDRRPLDPRLPRRGRRRRARARHPDDRRPAATSSPARPTRRCRTRSTRSPSTSTCSWSATTSTRRCPRTSPSPSPASAPRRSPPRTSCTTWARCRSPRSDAQAMGRIGEVITRTWQVAHVMKAPPRARSAAACRPTTSAPAATSRSTRSTRPSRTASTTTSARSRSGKLADLVLWDPQFFGVRPAVVLKGGAIVWAALGDPNASIPTPQPVLMRPAFGDDDGADLSVTLRRAGRARRRPRRAARPAPPARRGAAHPRRRQGDMLQQRRPARASTSTPRPSRSRSTASA